MRARLGSLALFGGALAFYLYTLQPSLSWGDGARIQHEAVTGASTALVELTTVNFVPDPFPFARVGVAAWDHPLHVMGAYTLTRLLPAVDPLWLVNLFSAVFGAAAVLVLFRVCQAHTQSASAPLVAALWLAVSHTFWFHAVTPEVYTLFAFLLLLCLLLFEAYERTGRLPALAASAFVLGLGGANHLLAFLALPAAALYWLLFKDARSRLGLRPGQLAVVGFAFLAGFAPYLIQFARLLRSLSLSDLMGPVMGSLFLRGSLTLTAQGVGQGLLTYLLFLGIQFGPVGLLAGGYGFVAGRHHYAGLWRKVVCLYGAYTLFGIVYRVPDQFAFLLGSHLFWALAIGMGTARLTTIMPAGRRTWLLGAMGLAIAAMPALYDVLPGMIRAFGVTDETFGIPQIGTGVRDGLAFYVNPNKRGDDRAYHFGRDTLAGLPPRAIVVAEYYTDTDEYFVLRYFVAVEGLRPDVTVYGWPLEDPFTFDSAIVARLVESEAGRRPILLASLDEQYYAISRLKAAYCIVPEVNLYRVYPMAAEAAGRACLE